MSVIEVWNIERDAGYMKTSILSSAIIQNEAAIGNQYNATHIVFIPYVHKEVLLQCPMLDNQIIAVTQVEDGTLYLMKCSKRSKKGAK